MDLPEPEHQIQATTAALHDILGSDLVALYLHGSAVTGTLRPQSDIDLLAIVASDLTRNQRRDLLATLLRLSARHPTGPQNPRCLEVIAFRRADLAPSGTPTRAEFLYGEWLRQAFEAGAPLDPVHKPDNILILAQARRTSVPLHGPAAADLLPDIPQDQLRTAMHNAIPELLDGLHGDERNVLLTLARIWHTTRTGTFAPKDQAAAWAIPHLQPEYAATLDLARAGYLGEVTDDWNGRTEAARRLAFHLVEEIRESA